jgi:hypothetical protein
MEYLLNNYDLRATIEQVWRSLSHGFWIKEFKLT